MSIPALTRPRALALAVAATVLTIYLLAAPFREGWTHIETDFPNYYSAAVLTLHHEPLRNFYDWTWFQRHIHYAGIDHQLGGYIPFTPLTMLHTLPLASLPPQRAKQVWMILEILFLAAVIILVVRLSGLDPAVVLLLTLASTSALSTNFLFGQDYLLLLLLLAAAAWCLLRGRPFAAGGLLGLVFAIKLYSAPFLFYFAVRRQWRALLGMLASMTFFACVAIAIFGFDGVRYFATAVLPRAIDGAVIDPYNPGFATMTAFLRHSFVPEAELNPHPLFDFPALMFFLRSCYVLGLIGTALLVVAKKSWSEAGCFAWFLLVTFAVSPNTASYHYIMLLLPIALLLGETPDSSGIHPFPDGRGSEAAKQRLAWRAGLVLLYVLVQLPLRPWDAWLFPKAWLLLALVVCAAWPGFPSLSCATAVALASLVLVIAAADTLRRVHARAAETPQIATHAVIVPMQNSASAPAVAGGEIVYQTMAQGRYLIRAAAGSEIHDYPFDGDAFHPTLARPVGPIYFELATQGHSRICSFSRLNPRPEVIVGPELDPIEPAVSPDGAVLAFVSRGSLYLRENGSLSLVFASHEAATPTFFPDGRRIAFAEGPPGHRSILAVSLAGGAAQTLIAGPDSFSPAVSPDGRLLAYVSETGTRQVWIRDLISGGSRQVSSGACNNDSPAWRADSRSMVIASDCSRGLGSPALYTIHVGAQN
ncbi:MAG TPA: glycosyltransferase 87 family protein [Bryobacteraceae bacterium]|nr:glycosyltransferase 87 family protein [Bryobacteraceae bacterium]